MKSVLPVLIAIAILFAAVQAASPFGGLGTEFGKLGVRQKAKGGGGGGGGCASPDAPDGVVDLSKCSNAYYLAVILL